MQSTTHLSEESYRELNKDVTTFLVPLIIIAALIIASVVYAFQYVNDGAEPLNADYTVGYSIPSFDTASNNVR